MDMDRVELIMSNANKEIPRGLLMEGDLSERDFLHKHHVVRHSQEPYTYRYSHPTATITAIVCAPVSAEIQSPDAEVIEGGINYNSVTIRLTPVKQGEWKCEIVICGKLSADRPAIETGRADASVSERSSRTIPQWRLVQGNPGERDALHEKTIHLPSREPYDYKYSKKGYTFTGISCLPVSAEIPSPEAEVIEGGINYSYVTIRLKQLEEGDSSCRVVVCGLRNTGRSAEVSKKTGRANDSAPASPSAAAVSAPASPAAAAVSAPASPAAAPPGDGDVVEQH